MEEPEPDLGYPSCCAHCPYRQAKTASCSHGNRQALIREIRTEKRCSVYSEAKTEAMRQLLEST